MINIQPRKSKRLKKLGRKPDLPSESHVKERLRMVRLEIAHYKIEVGDVIFLRIPMKPKTVEALQALGKGVRDLSKRIGVPIILMDDDVKLSVVNRSAILAVLAGKDEINGADLAAACERHTAPGERGEGGDRVLIPGQSIPGTGERVKASDRLR